jgi:hypothetical protein
LKLNITFRLCHFAFLIGFLVINQPFWRFKTNLIKTVSMTKIILTLLTLVAILPLKAQKKADKKNQKMAVLVIGSDIDLDAETTMDELAFFLDSMNFKVQKFYDPNNSWEDIKKASKKTNLFIYLGHGTHKGIDGGFGGLVIDEIISGKRIAQELKFENKPMVMFTATCGGAGSSASDNDDIGVAEAQKRVLGSSLPFFLAGAQCYYANNYGSGLLSCLKFLFENKTLGETYEITASKQTTIEKIEQLNDQRLNPAFQIGISSHPGGHKGRRTSTANGVSTTEEIIRPKGYPVAFIGDPAFTFNLAE